MDFTPKRRRQVIEMAVARRPPPPLNPPTKPTPSTTTRRFTRSAAVPSCGGETKLAEVTPSTLDKTLEKVVASERRKSARLAADVVPSQPSCAMPTSSKRSELNKLTLEAKRELLEEEEESREKSTTKSTSISLDENGDEVGETIKNLLFLV
jgi:hypothetical protein